MQVMKYELCSTQSFSIWFAKLKDLAVKRRILARLARVENGNFGDCKQIDTNAVTYPATQLGITARTRGHSQGRK